MMIYRILLYAILAINMNVVLAQDNNIGHWTTDKHNLPMFEYTGTLPYSAKLPNGKKVDLPADPWFLLGNYRLILFTHVSGQYELVSGQREWGRLNQGESANSGSNSSTIIINKKTYQLTGMNSLAADPKTCKRSFGVGYAEYKYDIDGVKCTKNFSVKPSTTPYNGTSAFLITITLKNSQSKAVDIEFLESVTANYTPMKQQKIRKEDRIIKYNHDVLKYNNNTIVVTNNAISNDPMLFPADPDQMSQYDGFPPALFMKAIDGGITLSNTKNNLGEELLAKIDLTLQPNEEKSYQIAVGYTFDTDAKDIDAMVSKISTKNSDPGKFSKQWLSVLPSFDNEKDTVLKNEMIWNAYILEALATYNEYFNETKIPQGTNYAFILGVDASIRDNFQHALPLPHYNPELAKSVLKYMMKRTNPQGRFKLIEWGFGYSDSWYFYTSDQQLFSFMYLAEYLRATKDYDVLKEKAAFYPYRNMPETSVLSWVEAQYYFLRDVVGTGSHGLVRLLNADWNDVVYHIIKEPYNNVFYSGESHMNSAMAISILEDLIPQLETAAKQGSLNNSESERLTRLIKSMKIYKENIYNAFMKDLGDRKFPRRMYFDGKPYGEDNMFLEPQGYTLQINDFDIERKKDLYSEMQKRVYDGEKIGARQQQNPQFDSKDYEKGSRENGGVWWALNGPVVLGVAEFNKPEAWRLLKNMTRANIMKNFPNYYTSYWSMTDNIESSLIPEEGLTDQTPHMSDFPLFCAHPHAWPLYCYYKLKE